MMKAVQLARTSSMKATLRICIGDTRLLTPVLHILLATVLWTSWLWTVR